MAKVPWEAESSLVENHCSRGTMLTLIYKTLCYNSLGDEQQRQSTLRYGSGEYIGRCFEMIFTHQSLFLKLC